MNSGVLNCIKELDDLVQECLIECIDKDYSYRVKMTVYRQLISELRIQSAEEFHIRQPLKLVESFIKQRIIECFQQKQECSIKRGRPVKNKSVQKKLAEWIRSSQRSEFTKKQLDEKYQQILGHRVKNLPTRLFQRILKTYKIYNIQIKTNQSRKRKEFTSEQVKNQERKLENIQDSQKCQKRQNYESQEDDSNSLSKFFNNDLNFLKDQYNENDPFSKLLWKQLKEGQ